MVRSYKEVLLGVKRKYNLKKIDLNNDLKKIFPNLKKKMTRSSYSLVELEDFLLQMAIGPAKTERKMMQYYKGTKEGIVQEDWLLPSLSTWLKSEMHQRKPPFRNLQVFSKINLRYPGETEGIEMDILGVGVLEKRKRQSIYEFWAIEAKADNKSFYTKIRQTIGYPIFIDNVFFAAFFLKNMNYSVEQRAFARRRGLQLLRLTSSRIPTPKTQFIVEKVPLRGGKDEIFLRETFGQKVLKSHKNKTEIWF